MILFNNYLVSGLYTAIINRCSMNMNTNISPNKITQSCSQIHQHHGASGLRFLDVYWCFFGKKYEPPCLEGIPKITSTTIHLCSSMFNYTSVERPADWDKHMGLVGVWSFPIPDWFQIGRQLKTRIQQSNVLLLHPQQSHCKPEKQPVALCSQFIWQPISFTRLWQEKETPQSPTKSMPYLNICVLSVWFYGVI